MGTVGRCIVGEAPCICVGWCDAGACWLCRRTALHHASENGHTETVTALVDSGADVHAKDKSGYGRPLHRGRSTLHLIPTGSVLWLLIRTVRCGHLLAEQVDGASLCLRRRPCGAGEGAGGIGRKRQRKGRGWVDGVNSATSSFRERPRRDGKGAGDGARGRAGRVSRRVRCQLLASNIRNGIVLTPHGLLGFRR